MKIKDLLKLDKEEINELFKIVESSLLKLYYNDIVLIELGGMEQSATYRFALYLNNFLVQTRFTEYSIDLEYNKNGKNLKKLPELINGVRPDLILHKRTLKNNNALVIEFKGWWNKKSKTKDKLKLEKFTNQKGEYKFGLGLFIELHKRKYMISSYIDSKFVSSLEKSI